MTERLVGLALIQSSEGVDSHVLDGNPHIDPAVATLVRLGSHKHRSVGRYQSGRSRWWAELGRAAADQASNS